MAEQRTSSDEQQTVVFRLGNESYGIEIFRVNEIIRIREITPVPRTSSHIRGLVNLRGKTIPVIDLRVRLSLFGTEDSDDSRIIVVESEQGNVGIIVDAVSEVITLMAHEIEPAPALVAECGTDYLRGVAKRDNKIISLLDLENALAA